MKVNNEEWLEWLGHPVTQIFRDYMKELQAEVQENWAAGMYTAESSEGTAQKNAVALGQFRLLEDLLQVDEESL